MKIPQGFCPTLGSMKRSCALAFVGLSISLALPANAGQSATAEIRARLVKPLSIESIESLDFGQFYNRSAGTAVVTVEPDGDTSADRGIVVNTGAEAGRVVVTGEPGTSYSLVMPSGPVQLSSGAAELIVRDWQATCPPSIGSDGRAVCGWGARLVVPPDMPEGSYSGTMSISVTYE